MGNGREKFKFYSNFASLLITLGQCKNLFWSKIKYVLVSQANAPIVIKFHFLADSIIFGKKYKISQRVSSARVRLI